MEAEIVRRIHPKEFYQTFLAKELRPDGRKLTETRSTKINFGSISTCDGSSLVRQGNTSVICGLRCEYAESTEKKPNGEIIINVELTALSSTKFEYRKEKESKQAVISTLLNDIIQSTNIVDISKLDIIHDKKKIAVWVIYADIYCLEHDGSLVDACLLSLVGALKNLKLPATKFIEDKLVHDEKGKTEMLTLNYIPIGLSFCVLNGHLLFDPTSEEEDLSSATFLTVFDGEGNLHAFSKLGGSGITENITVLSLDYGKKRANEMIKEFFNQ